MWSTEAQSAYRRGTCRGSGLPRKQRRDALLGAPVLHGCRHIGVHLPEMPPMVSNPDNIAMVLALSGTWTSQRLGDGCSCGPLECITWALACAGRSRTVCVKQHRRAMLA